MIGIGANVYWQTGRSKYTGNKTENPASGIAPAKSELKPKVNRPEYMSRLIQLMNLLIASGSLTKEGLQEKMHILSTDKKYTEFTEDECDVAIKFLEPFLVRE